MYQGEPGEEFGGHLTPMDAIDPPSSTRHLFATDDDEVGGDVIRTLARRNYMRLR